MNSIQVRSEKERGGTTRKLQRSSLFSDTFSQHKRRVPDEKRGFASKRVRVPDDPRIAVVAPRRRRLL